MRHVVNYSGGNASRLTAEFVAEECGTGNLTLIFADVFVEAPGLYHSVIESAASVFRLPKPEDLCARALALPPLKEIDARKATLKELARDTMALIPGLTWTSEGRTPWEVFRDGKFIGNTRVDATPRRAEVKAVAAVEGDATPLGKCERAILAVLSQFPEGCDKNRLTILAGYSFSGSFQNSLSALRRAGLIEGANTEVMHITDAGLAQGPFPALPNGSELAAYWLTHRALGKCERAILSALLREPKGMTADKLCKATGYQYSGSFQNALSALRTIGVLKGRNTGTMYASEELFD